MTADDRELCWTESEHNVSLSANAPGGDEWTLRFWYERWGEAITVTECIIFIAMLSYEYSTETVVSASSQNYDCTTPSQG